MSLGSGARFGLGFLFLGLVFSFPFSSLGFGFRSRVLDVEFGGCPGASAWQGGNQGALCHLCSKCRLLTASGGLSSVIYFGGPRVCVWRV